MRGDASEQQVRQSQSRCLAGEVPLSAAARPVLNETLKRATLAPSPTWWLPRTTVRSSLNWNELLSAIPLVAVAAAMLEPAGDDDDHRARHVGGGLDAETRRIEHADRCRG